MRVYGGNEARHMPRFFFADASPLQAILRCRLLRRLPVGQKSMLGTAAGTHRGYRERDRLCAQGAEVLRLKPDFGWVEEVEVWNDAPQFVAYVAEGATKAGVPLHRPVTR